MPESKHTAGPWESDLMADRDGDWYAVTAAWNNRSVTVADTLNRDHTISPGENRANAKLIAAAPDLLAACEALDRAGDRALMEGVYEAISMARAAIRKATGADHD